MLMIEMFNIDDPLSIVDQCMHISVLLIQLRGKGRKGNTFYVTPSLKIVAPETK